MAFIVPNKALDSGSPAIGAVTGFTQGLAQGIKARRAQDLANQHLALAQADQQLRQQAFAHGLQKEQDVQDWARKFGEFKAWDAAGAGAQPLQGPPTPGAEIPAAEGIGPPSQGPATPLGMGPPDQNARMAKMMELARTLPNEQTAQAFLSAVHEDEAQSVVQAHKERILSQYQDGLLKGHFSASSLDGTPDETTTAAAQAIIQTVQNADPRNPQEAAKQLDYAEKALGDLGTAAAHHDFSMAMTRHTLESLDQQIAAKKATNAPGNAIPDVSQAEAVKALYSHGKMTDEELVKAWPDAINGTLALKTEIAQHKMAMDQLAAENQALRLKLQEQAQDTPEKKLQRAAAIEDQRARNAQALEETKNRLKRDRPPIPPTVGERAHAVGTIASTLKNEFPMHGLPGETPEQKAAYAEREKALRLDTGLDQSGAVNGKAAPSDSAEAIVKDFKAGLADKAEVQRRAAALKLSEDDLKKLFGVK